MKLYIVKWMPNGWDFEEVGYFTDRNKAFRFAKLLTLVQSRSGGMRKVSWIDEFIPSMRSSGNFRLITHYTILENGLVQVSKVGIR